MYFLKTCESQTFFKWMMKYFKIEIDDYNCHNNPIKNSLINPVSQIIIRDEELEKSNDNDYEIINIDYNSELIQLIK